MIDRRTATEFRSSRLPAVHLPDAFPVASLEPLRDALLREPLLIFDLAHRGRYRWTDRPLPEAFLLELVAIAEQIAGHALCPRKHRFYAFGAGDYSLVHDDVLFIEDATLDLTLDLSTTSSKEAEVVFTHRGQAFFTVPQTPGALALVARGATVRRYDRYLTHRMAGAEVLRLRLGLDRAP